MNMRVNYNHNQPETADFPDLFHCIIHAWKKLREAREEKEKNKENADILVNYFHAMFMYRQREEENCVSIYVSSLMLLVV